MSQVLAAAGVIALAMVALLAANVLRDRGMPAAASRRVAAAVGGAAYLVAVLALDAWVAISVAAALAASVVVLRFGFRQQVRGLADAAHQQRFAEVAYALAGVASIAVGWGLLGDRWLGFVPIAFMAWGDNAAGMVRALMPRDRPPGAWPSCAMLV